MNRRSVVFTLSVFTALTSVSGNRPLRSGATIRNDVKTNAIRQVKAMPIAFEANVGQTAAAASFVARGRGYTVWATTDGPVLRLTRSRTSTSAAVVRMRVVDGATGTHPSPESLLPGRANYFIGDDPSRWKTGVPRYAALRYEQVYSGVDLVLHGTQESLEYDFDVAPHADASRIALSFDGAKAVRMEASGDLTLTVEDGELGFHPPVAFQERGGTREPVSARYDVDSDGVVRFALGEYDPNRPLIIDPVLSYSTYLGGSLSFSGGSGNEKAFALAVDAFGYAYVAGFTNSVDFPMAAPSLDASCNGCTNSGGDAWVAKIDPSQSGAASLVFASYLGSGSTGSGTGSSVAYGVAVDGSGNVYLTGNTGAFDNPATPLNEGFPTTGSAFQSVAGGGLDAFLTKLNPQGSALLYSTYIGGNNTDEGSAVKVDDTGHAYVAGWAASSNFPEILNGFRLSNPDLQFDGFVAKFNTTLSGAASLQYGTLVGGGSSDRIGALALDGVGRVYVTGYTQSSGVVPFPVFNGFQMTSLGGQDSFMTMINPALAGASSLVYSTLISSNGTENGAQQEGGIAVDSTGIVYVTGSTFGGSFPTTPGAFKSTVEQSDAYVVKIDPSQSGLASRLASTLIGGAFQEGPTALAIDQANNPVLAGWTGSPSVGFTACALPRLSGVDGFVTVLDPSLTSLKFSTPIGGSGSDWIYGLGVGPLGEIYVAGATESTNFPTSVDSATTKAAFSSTLHGGQDAFLAIIGSPLETCAAPAAAAINTTTPEDTPKSLTLNATDADGNKATPDALSWKVTAAPLHGTLDLLSGAMSHDSGSAYSAPVVYTPAANYAGSDSFQFRVNDGWFTSNVATVTINVTAVNDPPTANPQSVTTAEETPKLITLTGSDPENQSLSFTVNVNPSHGALSGTGAIRTYTPAPDYFGPDSFTFFVTDSSNANSALATVSLTVTNVNDAPVATNDATTTQEDMPVTVAVLANDTDVDGDTLAVIAVSCDSGAGAAIDVTSVIVTPALNFNGTVVCTYSAADGHGGTAIGQLTVAVSPVNDNPIAVPDVAATDDNTLIVIDVLANDGDPDGPGVTLESVGACEQGTIAANDDGTVSYTPKPGFGGIDHCDYTVTDDIATASSVITITVTKVNDPPSLVNPGDQLTAEGGAVSLQMNGSDPDNDPLTFVAGGLPPGVTIAASGWISGTPDPGSNGSYNVSVTVSDGQGGSATVNFVWVVTASPSGANQPPVCTAAQPSVNTIWPPNHQLMPIDIVGVTDPDGGQPTIVVTRILQDEPTNTVGDGSTWIDGFGVGTPTASVRAERTAGRTVPGDGRVYEIFFTASDSHGATCTGSALVAVPHDEDHGPARDSGVRYDSTVPGGQPIGQP